MGSTAQEARVIREGRAYRGALALEADAVVIGSGAGGMVAATILAESGLRVIVLEEGKYVRAEEHGRMRQSESLRHVWREGGMGFALGYGGAPAVNVTLGMGVGGSSVVTGGVCLRAPESVLAEWSGELGLPDYSAAALDPLYAQIEREIHVEEVPREMRSRSTELFGIGARALGHPLVSLSRNTRDCHGHGRCNFGCPRGAKMSVDLVYLPRFLAAGGELWSDCLVSRIVHKNGRASGVIGRILNREGRKRGDRFSVNAKVIVVACGGLHTPLLLKSSGLASFGGHVGENLTLHPAFRVFARFDESVRGWSGSLQSAFTDALEHERITMMSLFIPASLIAAGMPGVGPAHHRRAITMPNIAMFGAFVHDDGPGSIWRGLGREPFVTYRMSARDRVAMRLGIRTLAETFFAAGAKEVYLPVLGAEPFDADAFRRFDLDRVPASRIESASQHPLGSCQIGANASAGAVDAQGKLFEADNVFVADGSVIPTSLGVNPQLTIMAIATRIAQRIRERYAPLARLPFPNDAAFC
jgi:choline dehydrogenase-like flavoprotein